jgi:hypothetical protein
MSKEKCTEPDCCYYGQAQADSCNCVEKIMTTEKNAGAAPAATDTPECDGAVLTVSAPVFFAGNTIDVVLVDFARRLERELADARHQQHLAAVFAENQRKEYEAEIARLREDAARYRLTPAVIQCLKRGLNCWPQQNFADGAEIRKILEKVEEVKLRIGEDV